MLYTHPALKQEPRYESAKIIPPRGTPSLLDWLSATGHLIARRPEEKVSRLEEELELPDLIGEEEYFHSEEEEDLEELDEEEP
jgi:hypothetical protein